MKKIVVKRWKKSASILMAMLLMILIFPMDVHAADANLEKETEVVQLTIIPRESIVETDRKNDNVRATLYNCIMSVYCGANGMEIAFSTDCSKLSTTIGVKDIVIKQKVWYGWKTVATSVGGYFTNESMYSGTILYTNAIKGEEYRITCTHYADADEYVEVHGELDVIFTY